MSKYQVYEDKVKNQETIQFGNVYISELSKVVNIYKNATASISPENNKTIGAFRFTLNRCNE